jgi:hypothetical protein
MPEPKPALHLEDGHERRLQHLEHSVGELKTDVAENKLNMSYIAKDVHNGFDGFGKALEAGFGGIQTRLDQGEQRMNAMGERIGEHGRKFDRIDEEKKARSARWDSWKKIILTVTTGALAIGLKELVVLFIKHM